ncbi:MAG: YkgJ family cysteine cluster protein [Gemmatimonadota bacterium]|nr:YkgJ family cysteine cluster protein [Gemmatimonadota bacterium]
MTPDSYRQLLDRLDRWFAEGRRAAGGSVPCRDGCSACCHGPFDISVADAELIGQAVDRLPADVRSAVVRRAEALLDKMRALEPGWAPPYAVADLGEHRFDRLTDALAAEPCPLLDDAGRCRIYADRPLVCRMIGLGMRTPAGRVIENACPIQDRFPEYAALAPVPFELEALEEVEAECLRAAALRRFGDAERQDFETVIAAAVVPASP